MELLEEVVLLTQKELIILLQEKYEHKNQCDIITLQKEAIKVLGNDLTKIFFFEKDLTTEKFLKESNSFKKDNNGGMYKSLMKVVKENHSIIYPSCYNKESNSLRNFVEVNAKLKGLKILTIGKDFELKDFFNYEIKNKIVFIFEATYLEKGIFKKIVKRLNQIEYVGFWTVDNDMNLNGKKRNILSIKQLINPTINPNITKSRL